MVRSIMTPVLSSAARIAPIHDWPRPLAFALSGGGAFGSSHVGMIKALGERGLHPDLIVGTSVGSLNGVVVASNPESSLSLLAELWGAMDRRTLFGHGWIRAIGNLVAGGTLSQSDRLAAMIDAHVPVMTFDELPIPFAAVATDPTTGDPELLSTGPLKPALLASAAVPGVFPPVTIEGRTFIDGGISANVPIRQAIEFGARSVIVLDASPLTSLVPPRSLAVGVLQSVSLIVRSQHAQAFDDLERDHAILVLPSVTPSDVGAFNFKLTDELVTNSYHAASTALDNQLQAVGQLN